MSGYPPANRTAQWFFDDIGGSQMGPVEKVVWHTTEGTGWPGYRNGKTAPHYTVRPNFDERRMVWRQHFPDEVNSRALENLSGGVETNRDGALQVEIVGTCDETETWPDRMLRSWALKDWQVEGLARFAAWALDEHGVPLEADPTWLAYGRDDRAPGRVPASFGKSPARLTKREWNSFRGHCGHQHVPENDHGDPGRMPISRILVAAGSGAPGEDLSRTDRDPLEEIMALTKEERAALVAEIATAAATATVNRNLDLMNYVDALYADADGRMTLAELVQHAAGQAIAANGTAGQALEELAELRAEVAALRARVNQ